MLREWYEEGMQKNPRDPILSLLENLEIHPRHQAHDLRARDLAMDFARTQLHVTQRVNLQGHFTGSAFIVDPARTRFLLLWHRKLDKWVQPGGHADGDPDLLAVARREAFEESGAQTSVVMPGIFDLDIHTIPASLKVSAHLHYDARFLLEADPDAPLKPSVRECRDVAWMNLAEAEARGIVIEASVLRMIDKAQLIPA